MKVSEGEIMNFIELPVEIQNLKPYVPILIVFVALMGLVELLKIPKRMKAKAAFERFKGRAMATVTDYRKVKELRYRSDDPEVNDSYEYRTYITYQFEVNGQIYTGEGEGDGAFSKRNKQMICYDPNDPNENVTLYFVNSKTKSTFFTTLFFFIGMVIAVVAIIYFSAKFKK